MKKALVVIDVQQAILDGHTPPKDWPERLATINALIAKARAASALLVFVQHHGVNAADASDTSSPFHPTQPGFALHEGLAALPGDTVVGKTACDSFYATTLHDLLQQHGASELVICGCWTNYCVDTTCRRAVSLGYNVQLASDAHACGGSSVLSAEQIIAHHNNILHGLSAGAASLAVVPASAVEFTQ